MQKILTLEGKVQHYAWGGHRFIPDLLHLPQESSRPYAEYWLGSHPSQPATLKETGETLPQWLEQNQHRPLGFLMKVLDVKEMLSIQLHPSLEGARAGFNAENEAGVPLDASNRNYKDANHKPELMVALSDFWLLHGFRPEDGLLEILSQFDSFSTLRDEFEKSGYQGLYRHVMTMPQAAVNEILQPVVDDAVEKNKKGQLAKDDPRYWVARAAALYIIDGNIDRGIFSVFLLNLLHLKRGEGIFQPPGMLHAYLEGQNIELMATSDNVLRGGLTPKHIDINELMKHVLAAATEPEILRADENGRYPVPDYGFGLARYEGDSLIELSVDSAPALLFVMSGELRYEGKSWQQGEAMLMGEKGLYPFSTGAGTEIFHAFAT